MSEAVLAEIVPGSLEDWANDTPNRVAVVEGDRELTYGEWNKQSDRLAAGLAARGVGKDDIVVVRTQIRIEWPVILGAVSKLDARLLVQNWRLTPSETKYILENSGAQAFICDDPDPTALAPALVGLPLKAVVSIDTEAEGFERFEDLFQDGPALFSKAEPPLIVYTSGTTGLPKGVEAAAVKPDRPKKEMTPEVVFITMPLHHASGPRQMMRARCMGSKVVLMRRFDPEGALALIEKHRITRWGAVPTMYKRLAGLTPDVFAKYDLSSLNFISTGGGPTPTALKAWIIDTFGPVLSENYGATETGMLCSLPPHLQTVKVGSCGRPFPHVQLEIRDDEGRVLPAGEVGAIWAKTPSTIGGYLNAGKLDRDRMDERGFFKVGDVGRLDEEGFLYLTDRAIDMIVSGGVNIYPAEIEAALMRHPAVQDAAVVGAPDDEFGEQVVAFVELKPHGRVDASELAEHARQELASYKRPRRIQFVDELPRNTMGKILKRDLRKPLWEGRERAI